MCTGEPSLCATTCGDGIVAGDEECDDNNTDPDDGCSAACTEEAGWTCTGDPLSTCEEICGDGTVVGTETCDDGDTVTEMACDYGTAMCTLCNDDCTMELVLEGNVCGDGTVSPGNEECDDNDTDPGDGCDAMCDEEPGWTCMGMMPSTCTTECGDGVLVPSEEECDDGDTDADDGCDGSCAVEDGWTCTMTALAMSTCDEVCGDGMRVGSEACDDGNTDGCGLCNATCTTARMEAAADGSITVLAAAMTTDGGTFTLDDGINPAVTFEIDSAGDGLTDTMAVRIDTSSADAAGSALVVRNAINAQSMLEITATLMAAGSDVVVLTNDNNGVQGNVTIGVSGLDTDGWTFSGMAGGVGRTCGGGVGCTDNDDCRSGTCASGNCTAP